MSKPLIFASLLALSACSTSQIQPEPPKVTQTTAPSPLQMTSNADFTTTNARLKTAIETRGLTLFNTVDHAGGAAKADLQLAPNTVYIFGNPKAGTPLMAANPAMGLHLPLKAQVHEQDGQVFVTITDIQAITASLGMTEPAPVIAKIKETLAAIQNEAAGG